MAIKPNFLTSMGYHIFLTMVLRARGAPLQTVYTELWPSISFQSFGITHTLCVKLLDKILTSAGTYQIRKPFQLPVGKTLVKKAATKMARDSNASAASRVLCAIQTSCKCNKDLHLKIRIKNIYCVFV